MSLSRTFKISGLLVVLGVVLVSSKGSAPDALVVLGVLFLVFSGPVFFVSAVRHLARGLLWRVGSRLFVSYLLIGVFPLVLFLGLALVVAFLLAGALSGRRAEEALLARERPLAEAAKTLARGFETARSAETRQGLFDDLAAEHASDLPNLGFLYATPGRPDETGGSAAGLPPPAGFARGVRWILRDEHVFLVAAEKRPAGTTVLVLPGGPALLRAIRRETGVEMEFRVAGKEPDIEPAADAAKEERRSGGLAVQTEKGTTRLHKVKNVEAEDESAAPEPPEEPEPPAPGPAAAVLRGRWIHWLMPLDRPIHAWAAGEPEEKRQIVLVVGSSIAHEFEALFGHRKIGGEETSRIAYAILSGLGVATFVVYLLSSLLAGFLVLRIARATRRLSRGFAEIDAGNFAYRLKLKGRDQLAALVGSFNQMAAHLARSVSVKAEREALDRELEVARELQRRLLPPADFAFPGVDIAVDFRPAAAIGGDFYHLMALAPDALVVVIADVSGHGLPTGIVMAAARASLSALASTGVEAVALLSHLDDEIRQTTDSRTFVTLAHVRFRLGAAGGGLAEFTNAGHLYPYRVDREGRVTSVENPARPLGLGLPVTFKTVTAPVAPGDLWVLLSDGIVEATNGADEEFGFPRLQAVLAASAGKSAAETRDAILSAWRAFTGHDTPVDDRTVLVLGGFRPRGGTPS